MPRDVVVPFPSTPRANPNRNPDLRRSLREIDQALAEFSDASIRLLKELRRQSAAG